MTSFYSSDIYISEDKQEQNGTKSFKAVLKLFNPTGVGTWYLAELNPETNVAYGLCDIHEKEYGYVDLNELLAFKGQMGLGVERDMYFQPTSLESCFSKASSNVTESP